MAHFECPEEAEAVFPLAMMELRKNLFKIMAKRPPINTYQRKAEKPLCHICGQDMNQPGTYMAIDGWKYCCTACWNFLPLCGQCGKGTQKQFCRECIGKK